MKKIKVRIKETKEEKTCLLKAIWYLLIGKKEAKPNAVSLYFKTTISYIFKLLAFAFLLGAIGCIALIFTTFSADITILSKALYTVFYLITAIALFLFFVVYTVLSRDIKKENDKNYIVAVFSAIVSFAAMAVALIAFLK